MSDALLVLNAGSSSLKFSVYLDREPPELLLKGQLEGLPKTPRFVAEQNGEVIAEKQWPAGEELDHQGAIRFLFDWGKTGMLGEHRVVATGHRVVHGGTKYAAPVRLDANTLEELKALVPLAPLHQPHNLAAIVAVMAEAPHVPHVACFDTAFHRSQPALAQEFALPRRYTEEGVRRYGFHGLSYEYIASVLPALDTRASCGRTVVAHLGNGASMCAMLEARSIATSMSFTALDGLVMGTRSGALDPGVLLYFMERHGFDGKRLEQLLYRESGLLGVSGISSDMRVLLNSDAASAREAIELFVYRVGRELGSLAAALGGLDALVLTGGIGEKSPVIRASICQGAAWLGLELDETANSGGASCISRPNSKVSAWVVPTNEELMIARHVQSVLASHVP